MYVGTGTKAILGVLNLTKDNSENIFAGSYKAYNFIYGMKLLEGIFEDDYLFCRLTGSGKRKSMLYNISTGKTSDIFDAVDIGSVISGRNNEFFLVDLRLCLVAKLRIIR